MFVMYYAGVRLKRAITKEKRCKQMLKITLAAARVNAGYTQKEAAKELRVSNKTVQNWESGTSYPNADKIPEICALYEIPYDNINFLPNRSLKANN
jgi:transcriptional regulator with XRE-family HTH domain